MQQGAGENHSTANRCFETARAVFGKADFAAVEIIVEVDRDGKAAVGCACGCVVAVIDMVDSTKWVTLGADVKGDVYEGLLELNAEDTKSGAGQYFTPRALISAMAQCVRPAPGQTIADPACGTGGFFLAASDFLNDVDNYALDKDQKAFFKHETFFGN